MSVALLRAGSGARTTEPPETLSAPGRAARGRRRWRLRGLGLFVLLVVLAVRLAVLEPFAIPSDSMAPTLRAGDHVLVDKLASAPKRGALVVFERPESGEVMLKRVVAAGGQQVAIKDGGLYVDGRRQREPYVDESRIDSVYYGPVVVPRESVFVLGDNRADSNDSRDFGAVPTASLIGRVEARFWPPARLGLP